MKVVKVSKRESNEAKYYKRLILLADRYQNLLHRYRKQKLVLWVVIIIAIAESLVIVSKNGWL